MRKSIDFHQVDVSLPVRGSKGRVLIDGQPVRHLTDVSLQTSVGRLTSVTLTFHADVNVVGEPDAAQG